MNVFENEKEAREYVENTYGFIVDELKRLSMFESIAAELKITPFMVHRCGRVGYSKCIAVKFLVKHEYGEARLGFEE